MSREIAAPAQTNFRRNLNYLRVKRGLKQSELAEMAGCSEGATSLYGRGEAAPRLDTLAAIASALECSIGDLVDGELYKYGK